MTARLPGPPPKAELRAIGIRDIEHRIVSTDELWWRVHRTTGEYVLAWNAFREHGPHLRFDPHLPPARHHDGVGVWYGASGPTPALAEAFQVERTIDRFRGDPYLTGLRFTREVRLLDLAADSGGAWPTRAGGRSHCRPGHTRSRSAGPGALPRPSPIWTAYVTTAGSPANRALRSSRQPPVPCPHGLCCPYR